jgi:hypothetical protein
VPSSKKNSATFVQLYAVQASDPDPLILTHGSEDPGPVPHKSGLRTLFLSCEGGGDFIPYNQLRSVGIC